MLVSVSAVAEQVQASTYMRAIVCSNLADKNFLKPFSILLFFIKKSICFMVSMHFIVIQQQFDHRFRHFLTNLSNRLGSVLIKQFSQALPGWGPPSPPQNIVNIIINNNS